MRLASISLSAYHASSSKRKPWEDFVRSFAERCSDPQHFKEACRAADGGRELKRVTDKESHTPFSPYNLWLYRQTYFGIRDLLRPLVHDGLVSVLRMQTKRPGKPWLLEICLASTLKHPPFDRMGLNSSYKGRREKHRVDRARILKIIEETGRLSVQGKTVRSAVLDDSGGDALDSVIAAFATFRALTRPAALSMRGNHAYALEGHVYVGNVRSLI